jgi:D-glycero-D-manno-heptose 1,7-bisphosphate phosphatase
MLQLAMVRHLHTRQNSLYVGDRPEDEQANQRVGLPFQWAWDSIEQPQEAIAANLTEVK